MLHPARAAREDRPPRPCNGFTLLGLLILVAIIGIASAATLQLGAVLQRRAAEEELLEIGAEFQAALLSYANATPARAQAAPNSLQDLLKDPRYPNTRRHLRKVYADPMSGKEQWGTLMAPDGHGIIGIYSLAEGKPIKVGNFSVALQNFEGKSSYRDWIFMSKLQAARVPAAAPAVP